MPKADPEYDATEGESTFRGVILPCILFAVGFIIRIAFAIHAHSSAGASVGLVICQLVLSLFIMLIGVFIASAWMSINFGAIDRAILKLSAISLCAGALGTAVHAMGPTFEPYISAIALHAVVLGYLVLFPMLFADALGVQETLLTGAIVVIMQLAVSMALSNAFGMGHPLALFFSKVT